MSSQNRSSSQRASLEDLLQQIEASENPEWEILKLTLERAHRRDAELGEVLWYCAIPRRFDAEIIGILRQAEADQEANQRLLTNLLTFPFVTTRKEGGYVYHDTTRDLLLDKWQTDPARRDLFDQLNQRLVTFYESQHTRAQGIEQDLARVARVVERANPARYVQLASIVEMRIIAPLLEALYHQTLRSAQAGYNFFTRYYEAYEATGRLTVCTSLLNAARNSLKRLPADQKQESFLKWLRYWEARLARGFRRNTQAEKILRDLLPHVEEEIKLHLWVLGELGSSLHDQDKLREAQEIYEKELLLAVETRADSYNLPVSYSRVASLHWSLSELEQAVKKYREARQSAKKENNPRMEAYSCLNLSGVLYERGEWSDALNVALEGLYLVRTQFPQDRALHQTVARRLMFLLAQQDPCLLDTFFAEAEVLMDINEMSLAIGLRTQYVNLLRQSGQLERAERFLEQLQMDTISYTDTTFGTDLLLHAALLREDQGRVAEAIDHYQEIIERAQDGRGTLWHHAAALHNRGGLNLKRARWSEAESDLQEAIARWEQIGHKKLVALSWVSMADSLRQQGRIPEAQRMLDEARLILEDTPSSYLASCYSIQGHVYRDQARWREASQQYCQALAIWHSLEELAEAAENLHHLANIASAQGNWEEAAQHTSKAYTLWHHLAARNHYQPSPAVKLADEENTRGLRYFCAVDDERRETVVRARDLFRSASERVPTNFCYALNLAFACAELGEWMEAIQALEKALEQGPVWLHPSIINTWLTDYRLKQSETMQAKGEHSLKAGNIPEALEQFTDTLRFVTESFTDDKTRLADLHSRIGYVHFNLGDRDNARRHFLKALELYNEGGSPEPGKDLGSGCRSLLPDINQFWGLDDEWRAWAAESETETSLQSDLMAARKSLTQYLDELYQLSEHSGKSASYLTAVTPIAIEIGQRLIPEGPDTDWTLFTTYLPAMRDRIEKELGVRVPGVRIRGNEVDMPPDSYLIMLGEVPLVMGNLQTNMRYSPAAAETLQNLGIPYQALIEASHPLTGKSGCWIEPDYWDLVTIHGLTLWAEPLVYMVYHLEAILRQNLMDFLGIQEVENLLESWAQTERGSSLIKAVLPDQITRIRFARLLRALVRERVPITSWEEILAVVQEMRLISDDISAVIRAVRLRLKRLLPGNSQTAHRLTLPSDIEDIITRWVWHEGDKTFFALPPEETREVLSRIREVVDTTYRELVLVTHRAEFRLFVRRLVELEFPHLMVLAQEEVLTPDELAEAVQAEGESENKGASLHE